MKDNIINFPKKKDPNNSLDDYPAEEIKRLIAQFQNQESPLTTREEAFNKIICLTNQFCNR